MKDDGSPKKPKDKTVFGLPGAPFSPAAGTGNMQQVPPGAQPQAPQARPQGQPPADSPFVVSPQKRSSYPPPKFPAQSPGVGAIPVPSAAAKAPGAVFPPGGGGKKPAAKTMLGMPVMTAPGAFGAKPVGPTPAPAAAPAPAVRPAAAAPAAGPMGRSASPQPVTDSTFRTTPKPAPEAAMPQPQVGAKDGFAPTMMAYTPPSPSITPAQVPAAPQPQEQSPMEIDMSSMGQPQQPQPQDPFAGAAGQAQQFAAGAAGQAQQFAQGFGGPGAPGAPYGAPYGGPGAPGGPGGPGIPGMGGQMPPMGPMGGGGGKKKKSPLIYVGIGCGALLVITIIVFGACFACSYCAGSASKNAVLESGIEMIEQQCEEQIENVKKDSSIPDEQKKEIVKEIEKGCEESIKAAREAL